MFVDESYHGQMKNVGVGLIQGVVENIGSHYLLLLECLKSGAYTTVANIIGNLSNLKIKFDGREKIIGSPAFQIHRFLYYTGAGGSVATAGFLPVMLSDLAKNSQGERHNLAYGSGEGRPMTIEITGGASIATYIDQINILTRSLAVMEKLGKHITVGEYTRTFGAHADDAPAAGAQDEIIDLPDIKTANPNLRHKALWIEVPDGSAIKKVSLFINEKEVIRERTPAALRIAQIAAYKKPQTSALDTGYSTWEVLDFDIENDNTKDTGGIPMAAVNTYKLRITWAGGTGVKYPGSHSIMVEKYEGVAA